MCVFKKYNKYTIISIDYFWKDNSPTVNFIKIFWSFHIKVWIICTIILKEILSNNVNVIVNALILDHRKQKYKKVKTKIFCKVLYRYANNPVAAKKLFFRSHRRRRCWFLFFNFFFFAKIHPSFTQKISWQLKPTEMHLVSSKPAIRDFKFLFSF